MPMAPPLVSVVLPVFNEIEFVAEAIESILAQTYRTLEVLVLVEHGSSDGTAEYVKGLRDPRLRIVEHTERRGVAKSVNFGMQLAKGTYIARMDGDDISLPTRIEKQVAFMEDHPDVVICGTFCRLFGDENWDFRPTTEHRYIAVELLLGCTFVHPTVMFRRKEFFAAGLSYDESLGATEDYDLWSRSARKVTLANVPEILLHYRKHGSSATLRHEELGRQVYRAVMKRELQRLIDPLSEAECDFHYRVFSSGLANERELPALQDWFARLDAGNRKTRVYNPKDFREVLAGRLLGYCRGFDTAFAYGVFDKSFLNSNGTRTGQTPRSSRVAGWLKGLFVRRGGSANA